MVVFGVFLLEVVVTNERPAWLAWAARFFVAEQTTTIADLRGSDAPWRSLGTFTTESLRITRVEPGDAYVVTQRGWRRSVIVCVALSAVGPDVTFRASFSPAPLSTILVIAVMGYSRYAGVESPAYAGGALLGMAVGYAFLAVHAHRVAQDVARTAFEAIRARLLAPDVPVASDDEARTRGRRGFVVLAAAFAVLAYARAHRPDVVHELAVSAGISDEEARRVYDIASAHVDMVEETRRRGLDPGVVGSRGLARLPSDALIVHHDLELSLAHQDRTLCIQIALGTTDPWRTIRSLTRLSDPQITQWYALLREGMRLELADEGPAPVDDPTTFDRLAEAMLADLPTARRDALARRIEANDDPCDGYFALDEGLQRLERADRVRLLRLLYSRVALARTPPDERAAQQ